MARTLAVRVDDRLIHGQVITQWVKVFNAQRIVVIDDKVAADKTQQNILKFAAPPEMKVNICSVARAAAQWKKNKFGAKNCFVLFRDVTCIKALADQGVVFPKITLGNMSIKDGRTQIYKSTGFTAEEAQALYDVEKMGTQIVFQTQPTDKEESLDLLRKTFPSA